MRYYVLAEDGQRYGPADLPTLNQWVQEGRVTPNTYLEEESGQSRFMAQTIPGLQFPLANQVPGPTYGGHMGGGPMGNPVGQSYYRPGYVAGGETDFKWSIVCSVLGLLGLTCCGGGVVAGALGLMFGKRAEKYGHPNAKSAVILAWVSMGLGIAQIIFGVIAGGFGLFSGGFPGS